MNPWEIVGWVAAVAVMILIVLMVIVIVVGAAKGLTKPSYLGKHIIRGERR
jgi:hypothetical protein